MSQDDYCCLDGCCGPGSWCCGHARPHTHDDEPDDRACLTQATRYAEGMVLTERARGRGDDERAWLDMLALLERVAP